MRGSWFRAALFVSALSCLAGCSAPKPWYWKQPHRSVAVLPPFSVKPEAWEATWGPCEQGLTQRGFEVLPRAEVQAFMRDKRFTLPDELKQYTTAELLEAFGTDLILYTTIDEWDETRTGLYNKFYVKVSVELSDAESCYLARWGHATRKSKLSLLGAVMGSAKDLAAKAVHNAFKALPPVPPPGYTFPPGEGPPAAPKRDSNTTDSPAAQQPE